MSLTVISTDSTATCGACAKTSALISADRAVIANLIRHRVCIQFRWGFVTFAACPFAIEQLIEAAIEDAALRVVMMILGAINRALRS